MPGTLFVVATPIGNLEDLTFRALRILKEVDAIAAEDTRRTARLLAHYAVRKPMVSLHEHNEHRETPGLLSRLSGGESIALVTDAGTPGISDPGQHLVRAARDAGFPVTPVPGASAVMAALSTTGIPGTEFVFLGFPPRSGKERSIWFNGLLNEARPAVFFESPHRIRRTLTEAFSCLAKKPIYVHREISKINEEYIDRPKIENIAAIREQGEFVVVVGHKKDEESESRVPAENVATAIRIVDCLTENGCFILDQAIELAASALSLDPQVLKKARKKDRIARKRGL